VTTEQNPPASREGLVVTSHGATVQVEDESGQLWSCDLRRKVSKVVCGDRVAWEQVGEDAGVVVERLPRSSLLARPLASGRTRPVAANVSRIILVLAPEPAFHLRQLDGYLAGIEHQALNCCLFLNKTDLLGDSQRARLEQQLALYADIGYVVLSGSAKTDHGMDELDQHLNGQCTVLVGQSGVGKSSLIRHLAGEKQITVGSLSAATGLGRHTTSATTIYRLPCGGHIIDSPGIREFAAWPLRAGELGRGFVEFRAHLDQCRFRDCRHVDEPDCALQTAVDPGSTAPSRLDTYAARMAERAIDPARRKRRKNPAS